MKFFRLPAIILTLLIVSMSTVSAQSSKVNRAKKAMDDLNYVQAIEILNGILEKKDDPMAKILLAESYRKVSDTENAEYWYGQVVRLPEAEPVHKLYYGQMLQRNGKCDQANTWYQEFIADVPGDIRGQYLSRACDYENELMSKNANIYNVSHLDFNSNLDDFSPMVFGDKLLFSSERDRGSAVKRLHCWTGNPFLELFQVDRLSSDGGECNSNYQYSTPNKFIKDLNSKYHDAAVAVDKTNNQIYFTRNNIINGKTGKSDDGTIKLKVYHATIEGDKAGKLEGLPFNSDEYSVAHPSLSPDGQRLFFSSDMPGGYGGMDLYYSDMDSDRWGPPVNLGPEVNTEGQEIFPYYEASGNLYFASDGHVGLGGLDIYAMVDRGNNQWGSIENIGYPINTYSDDFGLIFEENGKSGYFSSDREGGLGRDDIYSFCKGADPLEILVCDEETQEPIEGAEVFNQCTQETYTTDADGKIYIDMKEGDCCTFEASKEFYSDNSTETCSDENTDGKLFAKIALAKEQSCDIEGIVFDESTGLPLSGVLVELTNDCGEEAQQSTTDESGRYYFEISTECCYSVKGTRDNYFAASSDNNCTKDIIECYTLRANLDMQPTVGVAKPGTPSVAPPTTTTPSTPTVSTYTPPTGIYKDVTKCLYMDPSTNSPADFDAGAGVSYRNGIRYVDGVKSHDPCDEVATTTFSPVTYDVGVGEPVPYLLHIYYDFDKCSLRSEATPELEKLCRLLQENPEYIIEIGSHTDARGSNSYNQRLSDRRAKAVVKWLINKCGVDAERLYARGYGEGKPVNNCINHVPCGERDHQLNRRTEFKVIGCKGCVENASGLSRAKSNPRVDTCVGCPF